MSEGWVKLHRKLLESSVMNRSAYFHLWVTLLLLATHKESKFIWNNQEQILKPGQLLTGRKKLSKLTGINEWKVERILKFLESAQQITQRSSSKNRIISIKNWEKYQAVEIAGQETAQQLHNKSTSNTQQMHTFKNVKNDKNVKNNYGNNSFNNINQESISEMFAQLVAEGRLQDD